MTAKEPKGPIEIHCQLTLTEELLGTASANPELHAEFVASKAPDAQTLAEEVAALGVDAVTTKAMTVFPRSPAGAPFLWDYQIKGFFKDACGMMRRAPGTRSSAMTAYKKEIDGLIFVTPRRIHLELPAGTSITECQRPLRAATAQGERVALAHSEAAPIGTRMSFTVLLLNPSLRTAVLEWLTYGRLRGLGQWRNSGKGTFTYTESDPSCGCRQPA